MVTDAVKLEANFREGSVLLQNDSLEKLNPSLEKCLPVGDGVRNCVQFVSTMVSFDVNRSNFVHRDQPQKRKKTTNPAVSFDQN